jgi:hypothetical protein
MCVILAVSSDSQDVTKKEFEQASTYNSDGYGVAWVEGGKILYTKAMLLTDALVEFRPPKPYVMHFRLATVGDKVSKLCHPFTVTRSSKPRKKGGANSVLFHNGSIRRWEELMLAAYSGIGRLPAGPYSDSRAVAMMLARYGENIFGLDEVIDGQRYALLTKKGRLALYGSGWKEGKDDKIWRSNEWHLRNTYSAWGDTAESSIITGQWFFSKKKKCSKCDTEKYCNEMPQWCYECSDKWRKEYGDKDDCLYCGVKLIQAAGKRSGLCMRCTSKGRDKCGGCGRTLVGKEKVLGMCHICKASDERCMLCYTNSY